MKKTKKSKKNIVFASLLIVFLMVVLVNSVAKDWKKIMENKTNINYLNKEYNDLLSNEEKLKSEVTRLQDDEYIARYAKEKYMYSAEGETIIRMEK